MKHFKYENATSFDEVKEISKASKGKAVVMAGGTDLLGVLKGKAMPVLEEIKSTEKEYAEARRLINILKYFRTIPSELVPTNSLLKEFLGGGDFKY